MAGKGWFKVMKFGVNARRFSGIDYLTWMFKVDISHPLVFPEPFNTVHGNLYFFYCNSAQCMAF
jgi:hypothetical protein